MPKPPPSPWTLLLCSLLHWFGAPTLCKSLCQHRLQRLRKLRQEEAWAAQLKTSEFMIAPVLRNSSNKLALLGKQPWLKHTETAQHSNKPHSTGQPGIKEHFKHLLCLISCLPHTAKAWPLNISWKPGEIRLRDRELTVKGKRCWGCYCTDIPEVKLPTRSQECYSHSCGCSIM